MNLRKLIFLLLPNKKLRSVKKKVARMIFGKSGEIYTAPGRYYKSLAGLFSSHKLTQGSLLLFLGRFSFF